MTQFNAQVAIIKKDIREALSNKTIIATMLIVSIMMVVAMPVMFTCIAYYAPTELGDFDIALKLLPVQFSVDRLLQAVYYYIMNFLAASFFILVPILISSVAAGSSFIGEKERRTLETLLYSPLTVHQLFSAKVMGALVLALVMTGAAFIGFLAVAIVGSVLIYGSFVLDIGIWAVILFLLVPSISLIGITVIVLASAKAKTFQEAQQYAAILIVPIMLIFILPQATGLFLLDAPKLLLMGVVFLALALVLMRLASTRFTPEKLLK